MPVIIVAAIILLNVFAMGSWSDAYRKEQEELGAENTEWQGILEAYRHTRKFPKSKQTGRTAA